MLSRANELKERSWLVRGAITLLGSLLHLLLVLLPLVCLGPGADVWSRPVLAVLTLGLTAMFLADSGYRGATSLRAVTAVDRQAYRWAGVMGLALLFTLWSGLVEFALRADRSAHGTQWLGGLLLGGGVILRYQAIRALGPGFITEYAPAPGGRLVQERVYRWMRHPSEAGLLLAALGAALLLGSLTAAGLWLGVLLPLTLLRVRFEERELHRCWGTQYRAYSRRVKRFIPWVL